MLNSWSITFRAGLDHRPQLMPIDQLGYGRTVVTHQLRDVLYRHTSIGQSGASTALIKNLQGMD
jgi:hypothetical protein